MILWDDNKVIRRGGLHEVSPLTGLETSLDGAQSLGLVFPVVEVPLPEFESVAALELLMNILLAECRRSNCKFARNFGHVRFHILQVGEKKNYSRVATMSANLVTGVILDVICFRW